MANYDEASNPFLNTQRATENLTEKGYQNDLSQINSSDTNGLVVASTNVFIRANNINVGMIQSFNVSESRSVTKLQSIGLEGIAQAAPQNTNGGTISANRIALYGERLYDAFKMKSSSMNTNNSGNTYNANNATIFKTLKDQRTPFEIQVLTVSGADQNGSIRFYTETYVDCWITSYKKSYTVQNITVSEDVSMVYADII